MKTRMLLFIGIGGLVVVALFAAGLLVGSGMAQGSGTSTPPDGEPMQKEVIVDEFVIEADAGGALGFPVERALRRLAADGEIGMDDVDAIMSDISALTDAVSYESNTSADGAEQEVRVEITITDDNLDALQAAAETALDQAVSDGRLTAEQAAAVLEEANME